jgi:hypothetical protein
MFTIVRVYNNDVIHMCTDHLHNLETCIFNCIFEAWQFMYASGNHARNPSFYIFIGFATRSGKESGGDGEDAPKVIRLHESFGGMQGKPVVSRSINSLFGVHVLLV